MRLPATAQERFRRVEWSAVWTWLLCFGLVAYLGVEGGGYDPLVHDQVGIAVWWVLLAGVLIGAFPRRGLGVLAWSALGLLAAFVAWTALSLGWTESFERTSADLARVAVYLGVFALVLFTHDREAAPRLVGAVAAGIVFVAGLALLSRLHPDWFPAADQTARFLEPGQERLSYPLHYWNAVGALIAIGLPLVLQVATCARSIVLRALAAAALPALGLTLFLTLSRSGIAAAFVALAIFLVFTSDRLPKLLTLLVGAAGGAVLVVAASQRDAFQEGLLNATAHQQGDEMVAIVLAVCLLAGAIQAGIAIALSNGMRPSWTRVSRSQSFAAVGAGVVVGLIAIAALNAPGHVSDAWGEFKDGDGEGPGSGAGRLNSAAGQARYQFWSSAVRENASEPFIGTGSGTFEFWWTRDGDVDEIVRDTHSLYLQTLGELGIVGAALLAAFLLVVLVGGGREILRSDARARAALAAALAGCTAFCLTAAFDWMWQIPVLSVALLFLAGILVRPAVPSAQSDSSTFKFAPRLAFAALALAAIVAIAVPLASTTLVRQSKADVRDGDLAAALEAARSAQNAQPGAATPRLQQALVLEALGDLTPAAAAARAATERESTNWRTWLVLSRIEAQRGRAAAAVGAYGEAKSLNPNFAFFSE
ncbi:MAG TPA: O-antigen ligase family protein [Solirubrobacterales bacterium]|nr:O-antigen ligase family protein [Solirubrobacterales bacterium]